MLEAAGFKIRKYHMNEGHSSLLTLELLRKNDMNPDKVRDLCIFTTHTPVEAGHDKFLYDVVQELMGETIPLELLRRFGGRDRLNMTRLALNLSKYVNGVAKRHKEFSLKLFPGHHIFAITNGVHSLTWTCDSFRRLYDKYLPGWVNEPELLVRVDGIPDEEIWQAHMEAKKGLVDFVKQKTDVDLGEDLYNKLEYLIIPTFYEKRDDWIHMMENSIGKVAYYFNSHRMMRRYVTEAYL